MHTLRAIVAIREQEIMGFLKLSDYKQDRGIGRASTPSVTLAEKGQIFISKAATEALGKAVVNADGKATLPIYLEWQGENRKMRILNSRVKKIADAEINTIRQSEKTGQAYMAFGGVLKAIGYDYRASGNQRIEAEVLKLKGKNAKGEIVEVPQGIEFVIPAGKLVPKSKAAPALGKSEPEPDPEPEASFDFGDGDVVTDETNFDFGDADAESDLGDSQGITLSGAGTGNAKVPSVKGKGKGKGK